MSCAQHCQPDCDASGSNSEEGRLRVEGAAGSTSVAGGRADVGVLMLWQRVGGQVLQHLLQHRHEARQLELLLVLARVPVLRPRDVLSDPQLGTCLWACKQAGAAKHPSGNLSRSYGAIQKR